MSEQRRKGGMDGEAESCMCFVCSDPLPSRTKLKTHLLLKHPELNLCLFCVGQKGWSDSFASQTSYNDHYWEHHDGVIDAGERQRNEASRRRREQREEYLDRRREALRLGLPPPRRPSRRLVCHSCSGCRGGKEFEFGSDFDRHLVSVHGFDYCGRCNVMGPPLAVKLHVAIAHPDDSCAICCSLSPRFDSKQALMSHIKSKHHAKGPGLKIPCLDCKQEGGKRFDSMEEFAAHLKADHASEAVQPLKAMHRRRMAQANPQRTAASRATAADDDKEGVPCVLGLERVTGLKNDSGQDCFSICILHLLAQITDLREALRPMPGHDGCGSASCRLSRLLSAYFPAGRRRVSAISPTTVTSDYGSFGIDVGQLSSVDCGDFLRGCLSAVCGSPSCQARPCDPLFLVSLEWKVECPSCRRYIVSTFKDRVVRLDGFREGSLQEHLDAFLLRKVCPCGHACPVRPGVKHVGKYVLVEVDRSKEEEEEEEAEGSKEISLYSLRLDRCYDLFGFRYVVFATVNYNLAIEEGGHYVTNLFPSPSECTKVHETDVRTVRRKPDFDVDAVIVAMKRLEMTAGSRSEIEVGCFDEAGGGSAAVHPL